MTPTLDDPNPLEIDRGFGTRTWRRVSETQIETLDSNCFSRIIAEWFQQQEDKAAAKIRNGGEV